MSELSGQTAVSTDTARSVVVRARALIDDARFDEAQTMLAAIDVDGLEPDCARDTAYALAIARRCNGDFPRALDALSDLLARSPDYGRAHQERGRNLLALDRPAEAAEAFAVAVSLNPSLVASWKALSALHARLGDRDAARRTTARLRQLAALPPELLGAIDLLHEGKLYEAERVCRRFLQRNPHHIEGMRLLAQIGIRLRIYDDAEFLLESCVELAPDHVGARSDYLAILNRKGKFAKAYEQAKLLFDTDPNNPVFRLSMANALTGLGRTEEGIALYRDCLGEIADKSAVHVMLGHAHKNLGRLDEAVAAYRAAYAIKPDYGDAFWSLANTKTYRFTDDELAHIMRFESAPGTAVDDRIHLSFAAGKALEDRGDFDESFRHYARGNRLKMQQLHYDADRTTSMVQSQIDCCSRQLFEDRRDVGFESRDPIFIVGLPRSGSTLLEQILASHSMVDGTMELHEILGLAQRLRGRSAARDPRYPRVLKELSDEYFARFGAQFIDATRAYRGSAPRFIDKMPNNFMHIGLIRLILPNAKIIDARRKPMACCFSGFKQLFGEGQDFTYDLTAIGQYYRDYVRLMDHWDDVLPGFVLRVMHEDVVDDLETQVRRLLDFCQLPFEPSCLEFHKTRRNVRTPSAEQVRRPIYRSGVDQWRNFEAHLEPLRAALGPAVLERYPEADRVQDT